MKKSKFIGLIGLFIVTLTIAANAADGPSLHPFPGAEFETSERELKIIPAAEIVTDSPQWVFQQAMNAFIKRDWPEHAKYVSPRMLEVAKSNNERAMAALTKINPNHSLQIADFKEDGDSYYAFMGFKCTDDDSYAIDYVYFLRKDGHWVMVSPYEWQAGAFKVVHN